MDKNKEALKEAIELVEGIIKNTQMTENYERFMKLTANKLELERLLENWDGLKSLAELDEINEQRERAIEYEKKLRGVYE